MSTHYGAARVQPPETLLQNGFALAEEGTGDCCAGNEKIRMGDAVALLLVDHMASGRWIPPAHQGDSIPDSQGHVTPGRVQLANSRFRIPARNPLHVDFQPLFLGQLLHPRHLAPLPVAEIQSVVAYGVHSPGHRQIEVIIVAPVDILQIISPEVQLLLEFLQRIGRRRVGGGIFRLTGRKHTFCGHRGGFISLISINLTIYFTVMLPNILAQ